MVCQGPNLAADAGMVDIVATASMGPSGCPAFLNDTASALEIPADGAASVTLTGTAYYGSGMYNYGASPTVANCNSVRYSLTPVEVLDLSAGVKSIAAGSSHNCAVVSNGVQC